MAETFLDIPVPEADPLARAVTALRNPALVLQPGEVLAHATVLGPFLPGEEITPAVVDTLRRTCARMPAFDFELRDVRSFEGGVVYLAPEPASPFAAMTERLMAAYPHVLPYGGRFPDVIPHVTVGFADERTGEAWLREQAAGHVPMRCHAGEVRLVEVGEHTFVTRHRFPLGGARPKSRP
jgi:hypothetical protein